MTMLSNMILSYRSNMTRPFQRPLRHQPFQRRLRHKMHQTNLRSTGVRCNRPTILYIIYTYLKKIWMKPPSKARKRVHTKNIRIPYPSMMNMRRSDKTDELTMINFRRRCIPRDQYNWRTVGFGEFRDQAVNGAVRFVEDATNVNMSVIFAGVLNKGK
jgi:hypothetical protein